MKKIVLSITLLLANFITFSQDYNTPEGAFEITHEHGWNSGTDAFTTVGATSDGPRFCGGVNRWFKFTATDSYIKIIFSSSTNERLLWFDFFTDLSMNPPLQCLELTTEASVIYDELVIGNTYYFAVIQASGSYGPFDLTVDLERDYNYPEAAIQINHQTGWSSGIDAYTTIGATPEGPSTTCGGVNRWFKFTATDTSISVIFSSSTSERPLWYDLFEGLSTPVISCTEITTDSSFTYNQLTIGSTYYLSVMQGTGTLGPFGISVQGGAFQGYWNQSNNVLNPTNIQNKVGIGTTLVPQEYMLAIDGKAIMEEVKVQLSESWPDYVFEADYELRTLQETKKYISENKHLPEIPSAAEIGENGIDLGNMNMRLLKKIEELTLYQIQLMEEMESMKKELQELKK